MSCFKKGNALLCAGVLFSGVSWAEEEIDGIEEIVVTAAPLNRPDG